MYLAAGQLVDVSSLCVDGKISETGNHNLYYFIFLKPPSLFPT